MFIPQATNGLRPISFGSSQSMWLPNRLIMCDAVPEILNLLQRTNQAVDVGVETPVLRRPVGIVTKNLVQDLLPLQLGKALKEIGPESKRKGRHHLIGGWLNGSPHPHAWSRRLAKQIINFVSRFSLDWQRLGTRMVIPRMRFACAFRCHDGRVFMDRVSQRNLIHRDNRLERPRHRLPPQISPDQLNIRCTAEEHAISIEPGFCNQLHSRSELRRSRRDGPSGCNSGGGDSGCRSQRSFGSVDAQRVAQV
jgi:hypothetical protein